MNITKTLPFTLAVAMSIVVHALVIVMWPASSDKKIHIGGQAITVSLLVQARKSTVDPDSSHTPSQARTRTDPPAQTPVVRRLKPVIKNNHTDNVQHKEQTLEIAKKTITPQTKQSKTQEHTSPVHTELPSGITSVTSAQLRTVLKKAFNAHFYYPKRAIRRNWSGNVLLSLRVEPNGRLSNLRIKKSSGFNVLDNAALGSLEKVDVLPEAIALLDGRSLDLVLPVKYRLL